MKRSISILLAVLMLVTVFSVTAGATTAEAVQSRYYSDVYTTDSCYDAANYLYAHGVMLGTSAVTSTQKGKFSPASSLTRGQIVTILWRMLNKPNPSGAVTVFADCNSGSYYYSAVRWASSSNIGIVTGYEDKSFRPNQAVTQQEALTFLYRFACHCAYSSNTTSAMNRFISAFNSSLLTNKGTFQNYSKPAVGWAYQNGFITNNSVRGSDSCSRGNTAEYVYKFYKKYQKKYGLAVVNTDRMDYVEKCAPAMQTLFKHYGASGALSKQNITQAQFSSAMQSAFSKAKALDICYLYCASHGSTSGLSLFSGTPGTLTPEYLRTQIDKYNGTFVVFISGCYSGTFISTSIDGDIVIAIGDDEINPNESLLVPTTTDDLYTIAADEDGSTTTFADADVTAAENKNGNAAEVSINTESSEFFDADSFIADLTRDEYAQEDSNLRNSQRIKVLCSSRKDESSYSTDRFATFYWCLGSGYDYLDKNYVSIEADNNSDARVSLSELYTYSRDKVIDTLPSNYEQHIVCYPSSDNFIIFESGY